MGVNLNLARNALNTGQQLDGVAPGPLVLIRDVGLGHFGMRGCSVGAMCMGLYRNESNVEEGPRGRMMMVSQSSSHRGSILYPMWVPHVDL